jgi:quercetin dioxygenase-like cupin family protein
MEKLAFLEKTRFGEKVQIDRMTETPFSKEIRICMARGNVMKEHAAPGAITIMVLKGRVTVASGSGSGELGSGDMVCFDANVPHSLEAHEESVIRLTLSKNDSAGRVISLV